MKHTILFMSFLIILFFITSCAEQEAETTIEQPSQQTNNEEPSQVKEPFKQYTLNDEGNYEFECTEEQQSRVNTFGGKIHTIWSATSEDGMTWAEEQYIQLGSVPEVIFFNDKYYLFAMGSCLMYISEDGLNFEPYSYTLKNENLPDDFRNFGGVDPTAIVDNWEIRLFFYEPEIQGRQPSEPALVTGEHAVVQYTS